MTEKPRGTPRHALLDHVPEMVTVSDRRGTIVYANPATENVSGYTPEEFAALDPFSQMHPEDRPRCEEAFAELMRTLGLSLELEHRVRHKDGSWRWVEGTFTSLFEDPEVGGLLATVRDVTARKEAEAALREGEERQALLLKLSDDFRVNPDEQAVGLTCVEALAGHMGVDRCYITELSEEMNGGLVGPEYHEPGFAPISGVYSFSDFPDAMGRLRHGEPFVVSDVANDPTLSDLDKVSIGGGLDFDAMISAPLYRGEGNSIWALSVGTAAPREWTREELRLVQDVAERTWAAVELARAEEALREGEERFRALSTIGSSSVYRMSPDWREMRRLDGAGFLVDTEETTTGWVDTYIPPDERPRVREAIDRAIGAKDAFELEHRVLGADGTVRWAFSRAIPLLDEAGEIAEWFGAATDVSARVKADQSFTRLFRASPAPFLVLKPDAPRFTIAEVNDAYLTATMRTREEVVGRGIFEAFPDNPGDATIGGVSTLRASLERVLAFHQPDRLPGLKYDIARPDGTFEERWWSPVNSAVLDENGEVEAIIHNANDVTEERRAEAALRNSEERLRDVLDSMAEGFALLGSDFTILDVNEETLRLDGRSRDELVGRTHWEAFPGTEDSPVGGLFMRVARDRVSASLEHEYNWPDGRSLWLEMRAYPTQDAGVAIFWRDVTDRKRAEAALRTSEERRAFLLRLNDALRPLVDSAEIKKAAASMIVEYLGANRAMYLEIEGDGDTAEAVISGQHARAVPLFPGRVPYADFAKGFPTELLESGETLAVGDTASDPRLTDHVRAAWLRTQVAAAVAVSLVKENRMLANFGLHSAVAREWTPVEIQLVEETAERTWAAVERARVEEALRASEEKYRTLFDTIDEGFCIIEVLRDDRGEAVDYRTLEANPAFERQTGLGNAVGKTMRELAPEHEEFWFEIFGRIARIGEAVRFEHEAAALGKYFDVYAFRIGEPGEDRVAVIFDDILPRKRAEEERRQLGSLEASAGAEEAERERISRELHDRVAHTMGVAHQSMELHSALAQSAPERAAEKLELAREATRTALDQTRDLSAQLARRGSEETRDGLTPALRELLRTHAPDGVDADLSSTDDEVALPPIVKEQAYLVMREAVRNAVAHSGCQRIAVSVDVEGGELRGRVEDDGEGFEPGGGSIEGEDGGPAAGVGLSSMRERTEMLNGRLEVSSKPGRGTTVEVRIPLAD